MHLIDDLESPGLMKMSSVEYKEIVNTSKVLGNLQKSQSGSGKMEERKSLPKYEEEEKKSLPATPQGDFETPQGRSYKDLPANIKTELIELNKIFTSIDNEVIEDGKEQISV